MPNKTIYVPDEELETYKKAVSLAGESLSAVVVQALKLYIASKETHDSEMKEIILWRQTEKVTDKLRTKGENVRFTGKLLGEETLDVRSNLIVYSRLYLASNNKFVEHRISDNDTNSKFKSVVSVYDSIEELYSESTLSGKLLAEAEKNMAGVKCVDLDI